MSTATTRPEMSTAASQPDYFTRYENLHMERTASGVLTMRWHTNNGPLIYSRTTEDDLPRALADIGADRDNKVLVITGTGDKFSEDVDEDSLGEVFKPAEWDTYYWAGRRLMQRLLEVEAPIVAAINGTAHIHSDFAFCADIVIASDDATFMDKTHMGYNIVPGDGTQVIYEELLGINRARYFFLTQQTLGAHEAQKLGLVNEVLAKDKVYARAMEHAEKLATRPQLFLRYTTIALRQRLLARMNEGTTLGMALEGLTAADMAYQGTESLRLKD
jgi:enoyl-CoA hydratase/carnithine racemase